MTTWLKQHQKALLALIGAVVTWAQQTFTSGPDQRYIGLAIALLTAAGVYTLPNTVSRRQLRKRLGPHTHTITRRHIPETIVRGRPLGRHVHHDSRSLNFLIPAGSKPTTAVSWTRRIPVLDQGQLGSCHDGDTDILTSTGWLPFTDLTLEHRVATVDPATRELSYEKPTRVIRLPYVGDIYSVSNQRHDFRVTPDHTMLVRKWDEARRTLSPGFRFVAMKDVGWYAGLMETVVHKGTPHDGTYVIPGVPNYKRASQRDDLIVPMQAWLRFLGIYLAEGTVLNDRGCKVQIAATKDREKVFVRQVMAELGLHALELPDRFTFYSARIWHHLGALGLKGVYAAEKFVPDFVFDLPAEDISALLEGHREGDGSLQDGRWTHHTSSPRLSDDLQRLIFLSGGKVGLSIRKPRTSTMRDGRVVTGRHPEHGVRHLSSADGCLERKKDVIVEHYDGIVYCAEVPTHHTLVTRRNGKILISGNCTANATFGVLGTDPFFTTLPVGTTLTEPGAVRFYSAEEVADGDGPYPPNDDGSSGLTAGKVALKEGLIAGYQHITSVAAAFTAIQAGPFIIGSNWYDGMDTPDANGVVLPTGSVRGGHEYECLSYDPATDLWGLVNSWGTSWGRSGRFFYSSATFAKLLSEQGDATVFTPLAGPAPTPTPTPGGTVVVSDPAMVAHILELAAKAGLDAGAYLLARLEKLWKVS